MSQLLLDSSIRVVAVLAVATLLVATMRRSSASLRAMMLTAALAGTLVLPLIALLVPRVEVPLLPAHGVGQTHAFAANRNAPASLEPSLIPRPTPNASQSLRDTLPAASAIEPSPHSAAVGASGTGVQRQNWLDVYAQISLASIVVLVWSIGATALLLRLVRSHHRLRELVSGATDAEDDWNARVEEARRRLGIRRHIVVRMSRKTDIPAVAGVFTPVLLLPRAADWSPSEQRDVVLHELAHVARWDALSQLLSNLACAVYWFIPLTWYAARHAAALRERACDNVVLHCGTLPSQYAQHLLTLSSAPMSTSLEPVALAMARQARIHRRVLDILDVDTRRTKFSASFTAMFIAAALGMIALAAVVAPVSATEPSRPGAESASGAPTSPGSSVASPDTVSTEAPLAKDAHGSAGDTVITPAALHVRDTARTDTPALAPAIEPEVETRQQRFEICTRGMSDDSINTSDSARRTLRLITRGPGCEIDVRIDGKPTFNRDFTDVVDIDGRGVFHVDILDDGVRRELLIRADNGRLSRTWRVDGQEQPYDADAAHWFASALVAIDRMTAFAVEMRLPTLLDRGGVPAVLAETGYTPSDYARFTYYRELSKARELTSGELARLVRQSAQMSTSDYFDNEILQTFGKPGLANQAVRDGAMLMIRRMTSDYFRFESIKSVVSVRPPSSNELNLLQSVVGAMESEHYKAETGKLLRGVAELVPRAP
jgi:beta-lactamase regulating signal transducer with metallopeptidase domain